LCDSAVPAVHLCSWLTEHFHTAVIQNVGRYKYDSFGLAA